MRRPGGRLPIEGCTLLLIVDLTSSLSASIYGAAGSLLVLLLWAHYSAQIFLFGAEFTKTFSYISGTRRSQHGSNIR
jgi:membrane protein